MIAAFATWWVLTFTVTTPPGMPMCVVKTWAFNDFTQYGQECKYVDACGSKVYACRLLGEYA